MNFESNQITVAITGPDGSGKSTACTRVAELLQKRYGPESVSVCSIWDALAVQSVFSSKQAVGEYLSRLSGEARTFFLFHAILESLHLAQKKKSEFLLIDGYFYKYAVSELTYGVSMEVLLGASVPFPKPDKVLFLSVTSEEAWNRKRTSSRYERGDGGGTESDFLQFQNKMNGNWKIAGTQWGPWQTIPTGNPETAAEVIYAECVKLKEARQ